MAKDYLNYRYEEKENIEGFILFKRKNFHEERHIIVDTINNLWVKTIESLGYVANNKELFNWQPLAENI